MTKTTTDRIESSRRILNAQASKIPELEAAEAVLSHVLAETDVELAGMAARRVEIVASDGPIAEIDKALERHDAGVSAITRREEVAVAISTKLAGRLHAAREEAAEEKRQAAYDEALKLHVTATNLVRTFLDRVAPEARAVLQAYVESERATSVANADLPPGASRIPSIEHERLGDLPPAKITERRFQAFMRGRDPVAEVGTVEAHNVNGSWAVYRPSRSVQGDVVIPHCVVAEFVEVTTQKYEPRPLEALATALRVPAFDAPAHGLGRPERRTLPASEWVATNGDLDPMPVPALAAE